jgi:hypothetical protein
MDEALSSFNTAAQLQEYVCELLSKSEHLKNLGVSFFAENRLDIEFQIKNALQKQGLACVVMTPNLEYQGHNGADVAWTAKGLTLQIVEYVPVNRASNKKDVATGMDIANYCTNYLGGPQCAGDFGTFCPVSIEQGEEENLLVSKATFDCTILGDIGGGFDWDGEHVIFSPYTKTTFIDGNLSSKINELEIERLSFEEYLRRLDNDENLLSNRFYVTTPEYVTGFGKRIVEVADPIDDEDAVNKKFADATYIQTYNIPDIAIEGLSWTFALSAGEIVLSANVSKMKADNIATNLLSFGEEVL